MRTLFFLSIIALSGANAQDRAPAVPEIAVTANGQVKVVAARAVLVVSVETTANSATAAAADNARIVQATLKSLRAAGVKDEALTNGIYSVTQEFENGDRRKFRGFVARNSIRVEAPAAFDVGRLIDASLAGGATSVSPIQFFGADMSASRRDALKDAVAEAKRDAEALAAAAGGSLGRLISVMSAYNGPVYARLASEVVLTGVTSAPPATQITPNDLIVTATVNTRWEFVPRR